MVQLSHEPEVLLLDGPSIRVDCELRRETWSKVGALHDRGTIIIATTHYIEEAEDIADRTDRTRALLT